MCQNYFFSPQLLTPALDNYNSRFLESRGFALQSHHPFNVSLKVKRAQFSVDDEMIDYLLSAPRITFLPSALRAYSKR